MFTRMLARGERLAALAALLALVSLLAPAAAGAAAPRLPGAGGRAAKRHGPPPVAQITLTAPVPPTGVQVTMPPVGLSFEYPALALAMGSGSCPPPQLVTALQELGSPPLALAGDSQDMTVPAGALSGSPGSWEAATLYQLPASFWGQLHCLLSTSPDPLTVGLNLKTGEPSWASQLVAGAQSAATNGLAFSLGNEPDLYSLPNYASLDKPQAGEEAAQVALYLQLAEALEQSTAGASLIGPELAQPAHWQHELPHVISQLHLGIVGVHAYPLTSCVTPRTATIGGLLTKYAADEPNRFAWVAADAQAAGVPAIISEANSVSCGGVAGVSDSPAAAVWGVRFVLSALKSGFHEVRFHFSGDPYDPFVVSDGQAIKRPLDSALVALNQWLPVGSSLRTLSGVHDLVASEVVGPTGQPLVILDNESAKAEPVELRGAPSVRLQVLSAARPGLQDAQESSSLERFKLTVAPSTIIAVSPTT